jgi:phosphorylcholine metabolism protein LicD
MTNVPSPSIYISDADVTRQETLERLLCFVLDVCHSAQIPVCLAYGTLLGYIRNRRIIPYDDDIDLLAHISYRSKLEQLARTINTNKHCPLRMMCGRTMVRLYWREKNKVTQDAHHATYSVVSGDIFYYDWRDQHHKTVPLVTDAHLAYVFVDRISFPVASMWPYRNATMYNKSCWVPHDLHTWLTQYYGDDYMTPKKQKPSGVMWNYAKSACDHPVDWCKRNVSYARMLHPRTCQVIQNVAIGYLVAALIWMIMIVRKKRCNAVVS